MLPHPANANAQFAHQIVVQIQNNQPLTTLTLITFQFRIQSNKLAVTLHPAKGASEHFHFYQEQGGESVHLVLKKREKYQITRQVKHKQVNGNFFERIVSMNSLKSNLISFL